MNALPTDEALRDRIFYIEIEGYSSKDKVLIVKNYILRKTLLNSGLNQTDIVLDTETIKYLVNHCSGDKGVRNLEKIIMDMVNKLKFLEMHQDENGTLPFDLSFKVKRKIIFPFQVNLETLKSIIQFDDPIDRMILNLYV
jgi:ATP-dependent Lon protease